MSEREKLLDIKNRALITDLYQLTMCAAYFEQNYNPIASFEMFIRHLPENRGFLVYAGLEQAIDYLLSLRFLKEEVEYLRGLKPFRKISDDFFDFLLKFKFSGDLWSIDEGEPVFAGEPILQVRAPLIQAQLVETYLLSIINFETLIASKARRVVNSARGRVVVDFGTRRAHGPEASVLAARASYIGGCAGTSNVYAASKLGIPAVGTMAHSFIMAFDSEDDAFSRYQATFPEDSIFLVDTFDTIEAVKKVLKFSPAPKGVRLDSGDLAELSKKVRRILDRAGKKEVKILASGDLNEYIIDELVKKKAPIDSFGVGTEMVTSKDAPSLGGIYKLVEIEKEGRIFYKLKLSSFKSTYPAKKQVFRFLGPDGKYKGDLVGLSDENLEGKKLLKQFMKDGKLILKLPSIDEIQKKASVEQERLPEPVKKLINPSSYPVRYSEKLRKLRRKLILELKK